MRKLIDYFEEIKHEDICPNCIIGQSCDGVGGYFCKLRRGGMPGLIPFSAGTKSCTLDDWKRCPLNDENND